MLAARRLAVLTSLVALVVVGCSEEPEPRFAEPSASVSVSGTSAETTEQRTVEAFVETVSSALASGDTSDLRDLTSPDCGNCEQLVANIERSFAGGRTVEGASWTLVTATPAGESDLGKLWSVDVDASEERYLNAQGELVKRTPATRLSLEVALDADADAPVRSFRLQ